MARSFRKLAAGLLTATLAGPPAGAQTFATPLPPGPGTVALPIPCGPMAAPVLMPVGAPTAAPVAVYHYPGSVPAKTSCVTTLADYASPPACGPRLTVTGEFLYWFTQSSTLPPLVTAAAPGVPVPPGAALGTPVTDILFGGTRVNPDGRAGGRFGLGYALADGAAVEAGLFFLTDRSDRFAGASVPGGVSLGRPVLFAPTGEPTAVPVAGVTAAADTRLIGWEANYRRRLNRTDCSQLDLLAGYRYLHLGDKVEVWNTTPLPVVGLGDAGVGLVTDSVRSRNNFHGPQVGVSYRRGLGAGFSLDLLAKVALGVTVARADQDGSTRVGGVGVPVGLLVGPSNTLHDRTSYFGVVPEAGLGVGYEVAESLRLTAGYTFLYWSRVRRAADQIDLTAGTATRPAFRDVTGDYWAQGLRLGLEWRY